ncbi:hypothetical protein GCM10008956_21020 [Deinococcus arenae]|uniref:Cell division protein FtsL n=2 Tax=Deinococcus TaxID=1298 RepID=A0A8H9LBC2_9DEIO|nr:MULTISPECIES: hypothetical protein [Deinococcus]ALW88401.1 hypothetical protein AUC44_05430 [Deinococcus actinosclerus]AWT35143.1 hypothetical protein DM785_05945 [Deinococcus actinosclerus]GGM44564.1 hypothetical protein GCM10008956_21020 [Deinococcus arenae]
MRAWPKFDPDLTLPTWRARAVRYLLIYVALVVALVSVRASTSNVRSLLREAQGQEQTLITQRDNLALQLQELEAPQRIGAWAKANGMQLFAVAPKDTADIAGVQAAPVRSAQPRKVEVRTQWK